ncbi:methyltransferase domain-containing protein [Roseibium marinum]|uniref:Methyltransferase family protein n=1 Tax=Roseibium marinum TaxID=281252 RepID=A0A2S3V318_9HYPH|nr:methyltransferase domain-containing protein [Roseibium marinum]POF34361.1 methyltransferase family protein [Roseibium marinum]
MSKAIDTKPADEMAKLNSSEGQKGETPGTAFEEATAAAKKIWANNENEEYRKDNSHFRGVGRWTDDERWKSIGKNSLTALNRHIRMVTNDPFYWTQERNMLEWGPGGGSNAYAFRKLVQYYYGVDISQDNLNETERVASEDGTQGFVPVLLNSSIDDVIKSVREPVDIFLSTAVFQHFPSKAYGVEVLKCVHQVLKPGGIGMVQIRFDNGNPKYKPIAELEEYHEKHITATSYALDEFFGILQEIGFYEIFITGLNRDINYVTYLFRRKNNA